MLIKLVNENKNIIIKQIKKGDTVTLETEPPIQKRGADHFEQHDISSSTEHLVLQGTTLRYTFDIPS
ncbi:MAG: hypothetical protein QM764_16165 [Chitinophagaceae bacterium]